MRALVVAAALVGTLLLGPAAAQAKVRAQPSLERDGTVTRLKVVLSSTRSLPAAARPRSVAVSANGVTVRLRRTKGGRVTGRRLGTWRSAPLRGTRLEDLEALLDTSVRVVLRSRRGTTRVRGRLRETTKPAPPVVPAQPGGTTTAPGGTGTGTGTGTTPAPTPGAPAPSPKELFTKYVQNTYLLRTYRVQTSTTNAVHSEWYKFCPSRMDHEYEGLSYIYRTGGRWEVLEAVAAADGSTGQGVIRFFRDEANFDNERGTVVDLRLTWGHTGRADVAQVVHPEIGTYEFARSANAGC